MASKTIKISEENYRWLLGIAADMQKKQGKVVSFDETLEEFKKNHQKKQKITDLAGAWSDMSDTEWKRIRTEIKRGWKKWKAPSV
ncbi:hypothetical protein J4233_04960 [Candidatus Pacearchaeota archaeon]|nr:hypothetical protein [Candidatus Pacearchaeota archaeon]